MNDYLLKKQKEKLKQYYFIIDNYNTSEIQERVKDYSRKVAQEIKNNLQTEAEAETSDSIIRILKNNKYIRYLQMYINNNYPNADISEFLKFSDLDKDPEIKESEIPKLTEIIKNSGYTNKKDSDDLFEYTEYQVMNYLNSRLLEINPKLENQRVDPKLGLSGVLMNFIGIPKYSSGITQNTIQELEEYSRNNQINLIILNKRTSGQNIQYKSIETPKNQLNELYNTRKELIKQFNIPTNDAKRKMNIQYQINEINSQITNFNSYNNIESVNEETLASNRPIQYISEPNNFSKGTTELYKYIGKDEYKKYQVIWYISDNQYQFTEIKSDFTKLYNSNGLYKLLSSKHNLPKPIETINEIYFNLNRPYYMLYHMYKRSKAEFKARDTYIQNSKNITIEKSQKKKLEEILEDYYQKLGNFYNSYFEEDQRKLNNFIIHYELISDVEELPKDYLEYLQNLQIDFYRKTSIDLTQGITNNYITEYITNVKLLLQELLDFVYLQEKISGEKLVKAMELLNKI
mgnify:CR=1 FL=1